MRNRIVYIFILFLLVASQSMAEVSEPIRLGATIPLSGDFATYGNLIRNGIDLAVDESKARF